MAPAVETKASPGGGSSLNAELPYLDGVRAVAVLFVFLRHAWGLAGEPALDVTVFGLNLTVAPVVMLMSSGVDLFFVLSGFLLSQRFFLDRFRGESTDLRVYSRRRFFRIYPPYWVVLAVLLIFMVPGTIEEEMVFSRDGLISVLSHAFAMQTLVPQAFGSFGGVASPFWTLTIEILFYILLPFVVWAFWQKRVWPTLLAALVMSLTWLWMARNAIGPIDGLTEVFVTEARPQWALQYQMAHSLPSYAFTFACGIVAGRLFVEKRLDRHRWIFNPRAATVVLAVSVLSLVALMDWMGRLSIEGGFTAVEPLINSSAWQPTIYLYLESAPFGMLYALAICGVCFGAPVLRRLLSPRYLTVFGVAGYGFYLLHMPILRNMSAMQWISTHSLPERLAVFLFGGGAVILSVSYWFHRLVELPYIARGRGAAGPERMFEPPRAVSPAIPIHSEQGAK